MNYRSYSDLAQIIGTQIYTLPKDIDLVVGIPRSGMFPAYIIANLLNSGCIDLFSFMENRLVRGGKRFKEKEKPAHEFERILIVDDSIFTGTSLGDIKTKLKNSLSKELLERIAYCAIYACEKSKQQVNYYFEVLEQPRLFEWNLFHHVLVEETFFDIDGVLCPNVPHKYNDDGEKYIEYISSAPVLIKPSHTIDTIISCRLEKYRNVTEKWLIQNGIKYNNLILLNLPDMKTRQQWNKHGKYKGEHYKNSNAKFFIESSLHEAKEIALLSNKPVYCVDSRQMINWHTGIKSNLKFHLSKKELLRKIFNRLTNKLQIGNKD